MPRPEQVQDERLRGILQEVQQSLRQRDGTQAVHKVVDALFALLDLKPELVTEEVEPRPGWKMKFLTRWPQLGANFKAGSLDAQKPEIEYAKDHFALSEAITYYEFTLETAIKRGA